MEKKTGIPTVSLIGIALLVLSICGHVSSSSMNQQTSAYIVYTKHSSSEERTRMYTSSLASVSTTSTNNLLYVYNHINAFAAMLTADEATLIEAHDDVLHIQPSIMYELHTTRTPHFLGLDHLPEQFNKAASNVIIGVLDTGVWPESKSFAEDSSTTPVPRKWKGGCGDKGVKCNRKLVGAKYFSKAYEMVLAESNLTMEMLNETRTARDMDGHGTHTSSTAAGSSVSNANLLGYADGKARGMAPNARIAAYKVCWSRDCSSPDILAAMDQAIEDHVDVLSLSIGFQVPIDYDVDPIAMGAFAAMQKGILVSCSAGNDGPTPSTVVNYAPWILTVGAGTLDRDFPVYVVLGSGERYKGMSFFKGNDSGPLPFVYARNVSTNGSSLCLEGTLDLAKVKGKIVMCDRGVNPRVEKGLVVRDAGGLGMVLANTAENGDELLADAHFLPAAAVTAKMAAKIRLYLDSAGIHATATITFGGTVLGVEPSPVLAAFSARGPHPLEQDILKPDLIAPGVNILAAWTGAEGPTGLDFDNRRVEFNIISGTSMSCPHVSGLAALLKAVHPYWSPAAIRSALMTTAYSTYKNGTTILDEATGGPSNSFGFGAGQVAPVSALDPGLVYDLGPLDYFNFLCALKYNSTVIKSFAAHGYYTNFACDKKKTYRVNDLNYPSFAVSFKADDQSPGGSSSVTYRRTLTNVGPPGRTYKVSAFSSSASVKISVFPRALTFNKLNQKESYKVTFTVASKMQANTSQFGSIEWFDGKRTVRSPVAVSWT